MKHIDILYDSLRYGLFAPNRDKKVLYLLKMYRSDLKSVQYAVDILEAWLNAYPDDDSPSDYWNVKWLLLKEIQVGKRLKQPIDSVHESCLHLLKHPCRLEMLEKSMLKHECRDIREYGGRIRLKDVL